MCSPRSEPLWPICMHFVAKKKRVFKMTFFFFFFAQSSPRVYLWRQTRNFTGQHSVNPGQNYPVKTVLEQGPCQVNYKMCKHKVLKVAKMPSNSTENQCNMKQLQSTLRLHFFLSLKANCSKTSPWPNLKTNWDMNDDPTKFLVNQLEMSKIAPRQTTLCPPANHANSPEAGWVT